MDKVTRAKREKHWDKCPIHEVVAKVSGLKLTETRRKYVANEDTDNATPQIVAEVRTKFRGKDIYITISYEKVYGYYGSGDKFKFQIRDHEVYSRDGSRHCTNVGTAIHGINELITFAQRRIRSNQTKVAELNTGLKLIQEIIDPAFKKGEYTRFDERTYTCIERNRNYDDKGIEIRVVKQEDETEMYQIEDIRGKFTAEQVKAILAVVKKAKYED